MTEDVRIGFGYKKIVIVAILTGVVATSAFLWIAFKEIEESASDKKIILATTTSTYDSGLLDYLLPEFTEKTDIKVDILSVGTGQAIAYGESGDCDVILVHSRSMEDDFVNEGYGVDRTCVMYNDFIIVGPSSDPAGINGKNVTVAMTNLKATGEATNCEFYSRGDGSGTHSKELTLWDNIPDAETDTWYKETGSGMGDTLSIADNKDEYTLVDRGTWFSAKDSLNLVVHVEGDIILLNPYGAIAINADLHEHVKYSSAKEFIGFLVSKEGQILIADFRKNNEVLFNPCFGKCNETHGCSTTEDEINYWKDFNDGYLGTSSASLGLITSTQEFNSKYKRIISSIYY